MQNKELKRIAAENQRLQREMEMDKILIVTLPKHVDEYSRLLENSGATVITINSLRNLLAGGVGRV